MEQRRLRLGDIVDDYCPRERRVTNHAVVAMIEEDVKQTRCTTCDAEHPYKGGKAPRRRTERTRPARLYKEVLAGITDSEPASAPVLTPAPHHAVAAEPESSLQASSNGAAPDVRDGWRGVAEASRPNSPSLRPSWKRARSIGRSYGRRCRGSKGRRKNGAHRSSPSASRWTAQRELPRRRSRPSPSAAPGSGQFSNRGQGNGTGNRFAGARANGNPGRSNQGRGQGGGARSSAQPQGRGGRKRSR